MKDPQAPGKRSRGRPKGYSPKTGKIHPPPQQQEQEQPATAEMQAQYKVRRDLASLCSFDIMHAHYIRAKAKANFFFDLCRCPM